MVTLKSTRRANFASAMASASRPTISNSGFDASGTEPSETAMEYSPVSCACRTSARSSF